MRPNGHLSKLTSDIHIRSWNRHRQNLESALASASAKRDKQKSVSVSTKKLNRHITTNNCFIYMYRESIR